MSKGGSLGNLIRLQPPLILTKADIDYAADVL
jgi:4-aminobutyrate aminotransferase-like enzyme